MSRERVDKWLRRLGYPAFGCVCFFSCLYFLLPYDRLRSRIEEELAARGYDVDIGEISGYFGSGIRLRDVTLSLAGSGGSPTSTGTAGSRGGSAAGATSSPGASSGASPGASPGAATEGGPASPGSAGSASSSGAATSPAGGRGGERASRLVIDELHVRVSVLPLIFGIVDVSFGLEGLGGTLDGSFRRGKQDARARLRTRDLALGQIPGLADKLGLPLAGRLDLEVELELPQQKFAEARGSIDLSCSECSVGDGKAKLKIPSDPFLAQGVTVPRVRLGTLRGQVTVEKGAASLHKVEAKSADAELSLDGRIDLADPVTRSQLQLYLRFRPSAAMIQREATFQLLTSSLESGKRSDGFFGLAVGGTLAAPQVRPSKQDMTSKFPSRGAPYRGEGRRPGGRELGRGLGGGLGRPDTLGPRGLRDFDLRPSGGEPRGGELRGSEARPEGLPEAQPMLPQPSPPPPPLPPPPPPPSPTPSSPPAAAPPAAAPSPPPGVPPGIMRIVPVDPRPADAGAPAASEAPAPETPAPPAPEPAPAPPED